MKITIAGIDFDYHDYDERGDVLYLHVGEPKKPPAKRWRPPRDIPSNTTSRGRWSGWSCWESRGRLSTTKRYRSHVATGPAGGKCSARGAGCVKRRRTSLEGWMFLKVFSRGTG
jgi:hypothetical protein